MHMLRARIASIILSALGMGLLLLALMLWARMWLAENLSAEQRELYLTYQWVPDPTVVPVTPTATPIPTPTPQPQPPTRLVIPRIGVNSVVHQIGINVGGDPLDPRVTWQKLKAGVGHDQDSVNPGESGNIVLFGHNNVAGRVFRRLSELKAGDEAYLYTLDLKFSYIVQEIDIVRAVATTEQDKGTHAFYLGPKPEETLTLVSCWPYSTYTHRVYVVAKPVSISDQ